MGVMLLLRNEPRVSVVRLSLRQLLSSEISTLMIARIQKGFKLQQAGAGESGCRKHSQEQEQQQGKRRQIAAGKSLPH